MHRDSMLLLAPLLLSAVLFSLAYHRVPLAQETTTNLIAGVFFKNSIETKDIIKTYKLAVVEKRKEPEKVKILIVPGHDNTYSGAQIGGVTEASLNLKLGLELEKLLAKERGIEVMMTRNGDGYHPDFLEYVAENQEEILAFRAEKKGIMEQLIREGKVESSVVIHHNTARPEVAEILYGANMYASEHNYDIVLHIHFNDYPGRKGMNGKYSGFSIYVPESQYSNAEASRDFGERLRDQLLRISASSNLPNEEAITEDQELIAVGAYNTLDSAVALIEYGYIYESQFTDPAIASVLIKELARQTYFGILSYLRGAGEVLGSTFPSLNEVSLPDSLVRGASGVSVLKLQDILRDAGFYPVHGNMNTCPLSGKFGSCTEDALRAYQKAKGILPTGIVNGATREALVKEGGLK